MKKIDLHIHSDFSDGNYSISEICERCKNEGVYEIAITDHDTVEGCKEAVRIIASNPEKYKNLVVRVAGYSALFTTLSRSLQDDIINRTEQGGF